ncbi:hypothetical protein N8I74_10915 [Chitiniphilus purpureus]|uniref:DksA C4-type domain-containing protein n=1 Tax=Chitiniphilus purpureus TaxID=2981137 RepID=A0ABY6DHX9_9NEIS|nr:hypothetical protein [Chitiniphilus sp. CD1]UXY13833.1 hypothetical protein N8I74_10915 [Chitiniphilus sp. CD1]
MADPSDIASDLEIAARNAAIATESITIKRYRLDCIDCGEDLPPHRVEPGICVDCLTAREHRDKMRRR